MGKENMHVTKCINTAIDQNTFQINGEDSYKQLDITIAIIWKDNLK